jgi:alpha,alpha-trehalose phosphorylase (configuration-retaining)
LIYDSTITLLETTYPDLLSDIILVRLPPSDQLLNTLLSTTHIALQLSTREGFEIKVSEALHKGKPVIATRAGGIPLQVKHNKNGFLVEVGDTAKVAEYLYKLWTDEELYASMSKEARLGVSDEVSTVGNALCWLWMVREMSAGRKRSLRGRWINDLAREEAGEPYKPDENRLPRNVEV